MIWLDLIWYDLMDLWCIDNIIPAREGAQCWDGYPASTCDYLFFITLLLSCPPPPLSLPLSLTHTQKHTHTHTLPHTHFYTLSNTHSPLPFRTKRALNGRKEVQHSRVLRRGVFKQSAYQNPSGNTFRLVMHSFVPLFSSPKIFLQPYCNSCHKTQPFTLV